MADNNGVQNEELEHAQQKASTLSSPQHKAVILEKAGFWRRFFAYSIDWIVIGIIGKFFPFLVSDDGASLWGGLILIVLSILIPAVYFIWPYSRGGQTLGKRFLGIRVVSIDGSPLNWKQGIARTIGYIPSTLILYIGFLWAIWDGDNQAWQDKLAGTLVLRTSDFMEQFQGHIEPAEADRRRKKWLLGLGVPTAIFITVGVIAYVSFILGGLSEIRGMGDWPSTMTLPEQALDIDLSHLGLEISEVIDAREEGTWELGQYEKGILISFESGGKDIVHIWALRYSDTNIASNDFDTVLVSAKENCGLYTYRVAGGSGILECKWTGAYNKILLNQYWIVDIFARQGGNFTPENLVDQILKSISAHWEHSP